MMRYTISILAASLFAGSMMSAGPLRAEVPVVVADIQPVHSLVAQVMGDLGQPLLLLERGANEHDVQLRPSQLQALTDAALVVWIGPELTPWLDRALTSTSTADRLGLLAVPGTARRAFAPEDADAGHGTDPHAWLDPDNARLWLGAIARALAASDPANAAIYAANAENAETELAALDTELREKLAPVAQKPFVTFHDAYGFFAAHYGLAYAGSLAAGDATLSGAARLAALTDQIAAGGAVCVFPEVQHDSDLIAQLAVGGTARLGAALDPSGSTLPAGAGNYAALMAGLATALAECLGQ